MMRSIALLFVLLAISHESIVAQLGKPVTVSLVSDHQVIAPGKTFHVGLKMVHGPGWHTYWTNPGTGIATEVSWEMPDGFKVGPKISPIPEVKTDEVGNTHIYHNTIYHVYEVTPPAGLTAGSSVTLNGAASWLQCVEDKCDPPQSQAVSLTLKVGEEIQEGAEVKATFQKILDEQPKPLEAWSVAFEQTDESVTLKLTPGEGANDEPGAAYVFEEEQLLEAVNPISASEGKMITLTLPKMESGPIDGLKGYLYAPNGWLKDGGPKAMSIAAGGDGNGASGFVTLSGGEEKRLTILKALFLAFVGGMILNLMPCVFPVLSIKILGFVEQAGEDPGKVKQHGMVFALGILVSCWILAGILIGIKVATGEDVGWGSHLQSPIVTAVIVFIMFALGLNLAGLFELGTSMVGVGGDLMQKKGLSGSFFSGVLTTVVATPCSGPFLGAVMSYTFSQPIPVAFLLFTVFALGVAAPYVILSFFPQLINKLPPPGAWMETFKQIMAFPMFAAAIFFLNAFANKTGVGGAIWLLVGLLILAVALWVYGKWCSPMNKKTTRYRGLGFALLLAVLGFYISFDATKRKPAESGGIKEISELVARIRDLREEGRMVYVDFTASW